MVAKNQRLIEKYAEAHYWLTSNNPKVRSIRDLTEKDRIAVPATRVSINSVILQIAAEKEFGPGHHCDLEPFTTTLSPPEATAALVSGKTEIIGQAMLQISRDRAVANAGEDRAVAGGQQADGPLDLGGYRPHKPTCKIEK